MTSTPVVKEGQVAGDVTVSTVRLRPNPLQPRRGLGTAAGLAHRGTRTWVVAVAVRAGQVSTAPRQLWVMAARA